MSVQWGEKTTRFMALREGYTVDTTCYPWVAYKGSRCDPTALREVYTDEEARLMGEVLAYRRHIANLVFSIMNLQTQAQNIRLSGEVKELQIVCSVTDGAQATSDYVNQDR